jgi:hypothetical protein
VVISFIAKSRQFVSGAVDSLSDVAFADFSVLKIVEAERDDSNARKPGRNVMKGMSLRPGVVVPLRCVLIRSR